MTYNDCYVEMPPTRPTCLAGDKRPPDPSPSSRSAQGDYLLYNPGGPGPGTFPGVLRTRPPTSNR